MYIPPEDSPLCDPSLFGSLNTRWVEGDVTVLGDFTARVGSPRITDDSGDVYEYSDVNDVVVNSHGRALLSICENKMRVAHDLKHNKRTLYYRANTVHLVIRNRFVFSEIQLHQCYSEAGPEAGHHGV